MRLPFLISAIVPLCILGCSSSSKAKPAPVRVETAVNDAARFLAGLEGRPGSIFHELEATPEWKTHAAAMNRLWSDFERAYLEPARGFQRREMEGAIQYSETVFYPFSGPDVAFVLTFFPSAKTYILAGLEPPGPVPTPELYPATHLDKALGGLRMAAGEMFGRSFFVTREMDRQFRGQVARGLLPAMLMLAARLGCDVESVRHVELTRDGSLLDFRGAERPKAVEIQLRRPGGASAKLYYFSTDLAKGLERDPRFLKFVESFPAPDTFVKSGSFLLHWRMCDRLRAFILEKSRNVLQDDTGIPYRYFAKAGWEVRLYGEYAPPDPPFRRQYQKDLAAAYEEPGRVKSLGFSLGYGARKRSTALILASKRTETAQSGDSRKAHP